MSLREGDLKDLISEVFEVDGFQSKMGDDKNIITVSFNVEGRDPANDLANFLEKGYDFILDADVTSGEQANGKYKVFVELERQRNAASSIMEMLDGISKLGEIDQFRFRYYKNFHSKDATLEELTNSVPQDPDGYVILANESNLSNFKNFFNKSFVDDIDMINETLSIKRKWADPLVFEFIDFGDTLKTIDNIDGRFDIMESYPEILFLTKYIGDYNISKYGDNLVFENEGKALVLKRI
jgi:hypothetical protein|tara:strand:- start:121 stop:837 length:717 start_codon:yes stop_codon:yes gene_type:complete